MKKVLGKVFSSVDRPGEETRLPHDVCEATATSGRSPLEQKEELLGKAEMLEQQREQLLSQKERELQASDIEKNREIQQLRTRLDETRRLHEQARQRESAIASELERLKRDLANSVAEARRRKEALCRDIPARRQQQDRDFQQEAADWRRAEAERLEREHRARLAAREEEERRRMAEIEATRRAEDEAIEREGSLQSGPQQDRIAMLERELVEASRASKDAENEAKRTENQILCIEEQNKRAAAEAVQALEQEAKRLAAAEKAAMAGAQEAEAKGEREAVEREQSELQRMREAEARRHAEEEKNLQQQLGNLSLQEREVAEAELRKRREKEMECKEARRIPAHPVVRTTAPISECSVTTTGVQASSVTGTTQQGIPEGSMVTQAPQISPTTRDTTGGISGISTQGEVSHHHPNVIEPGVGPVTETSGFAHPVAEQPGGTITEPARYPSTSPGKVLGSSRPEHSAYDIHPNDLAEYQRDFVNADLNKDGFINFKELEEYAFSRHTVPADVRHNIWKLADKNGDDKLDQNEFATAMHLLKEWKSNVPLPGMSTHFAHSHT
ncbi:hypothetical protein Pelo_6134 [Pelomyxa schiedti]|nr:hypothetical protein Pelo_6134 [Pelomyxa schiedti]